MSETAETPARPSLAKRGLRACGRVAFVVVALCLLGAVTLVDVMDDAPLLGSAAAGETEALLGAAAEEARARPPERGAVQLGWSVAEITPALGAPTYGYGARRGKGVEAIKDPVWARSLALRVGDGPPLIFVSADICLWVHDVSTRVASEVSDLAPRERIYFGATHDHSGPGGYADGPAARLIMGERKPELVDALVAGTVKAIREAVADLSPGALREISAPMPVYVQNRMQRGDPLDDELFLLEARKAGGRRFALITYSAHATAIGHRSLVCSGDYPGALCRTLLQSGYDGALFFASETGQAGPVMAGEAVTSSDVDRAWRLGEALAAEVVKLSKGCSSPYTSETSLRVFRSQVKVSGYRWPRFGGMIDPDIAAWLVGYDEPIIHVHGLRLGTTVWLGHSFEFSSVIGRRLKARAQAKGHRLVLTSFNGDHNLYVIPESYWGQGYESGMTLYGPGLGPYMQRISEQVDDALSDLDAEPAPTFDLGPKD